MFPTDAEEPPGAGLIRSAPLTPADEQEIAAFIADSKRRNAALIQCLRAKHALRDVRPVPAPGPTPHGGEDSGS